MYPNFSYVTTTAAAASRSTPTKKDENTRVPSPSTLSTSVPALEAGSNDDVVAGDKSKAITEYRKIHGEKSDSGNEETIVYSKSKKDGFEMVPLEDTGEQ